MFTSVESEQIILGALLKNNQPLATLELKGEHFTSPHAELFDQMKSMYMDNGQISWPALTLWAQGRSFREAGDGLTYPRDLMECAIVSNDLAITQIAEDLIELWRRRELYNASLVLQSEITAKGAAQALADFVKSIDGQQSAPKVFSALQVREDIVQSLEMPRESDSTGMDRLDSVMGGGLYRGYTYGFCGAEKSGKTTLAHTVSYNLAKKGTAHLYVAMEMGSFQIEQRNLAREKEFNSLTFLDNIEKAKSKMHDLGAMDGLYYLDAPGMATQEILHHVALSIARHGIKGFIVDYWQLVQGQQRGESEEKHLRTVAQAFADFARKNKVWCLLLAQMNQDGKLFGGNGLRKACDQLYMIEQIEGDKANRWLRMDASRYTMRGDIGSETNPSYCIDGRIGPHFREY